MEDVIPIGYTVLVEPEAFKETYKDSKIIKATETTKKFEEQAQVKGTVLAIGPDAWTDYIDKSVRVGDVVFYQRHAGMRLLDEDGNVLMNRLLLKDTDIVARFPRG